MKRDLPGPAETEALGADLAAALRATARGAVITLAGELGAGKTALVRAILSALGHAGPVVSPSYTLIEPYDIEERRVWHLDLYRIGDPEELEFIGVRDLSPENDWTFIEWAERGSGFLPAADLAFTLAYRNHGRSIVLEARSAAGRQLLENLENHGSASSVD